MNVLLLGSGGREHALAWKLAQAPSVTRLYAAPGNPGIAEEAELVTLDAADHAAVIAFCQGKGIDLVVIGPEAPLVDGLADSLRAEGIPAFGPSKAAAQLEGSKGFTKDLCARANIPTGGYVRTRSIEEADRALTQFTAPYVLKADGLAAGKGVVIAESIEQAEIALADMFGGGFGEAGAEVVIEEFLHGEEASFFAITDGTTVIPFGTAQDHKQVGEGDTGPNTGGMGAYSPAPVLSDAVAERALERIVKPTVAEMARRGTPYRGVLYAGLMIDKGEPRLVEYNARFGDPETQVLMMRLGGQALDLMLACAEGRLAEMAVNWADDHAMTVVMAARGYPGAYAKGSVIGGLDRVAEDSHHMVFHAGTRAEGGTVRANGGRVLNVTARGATLAEARARAYAMVARIDWPEGVYRRDIGWRAL